MEENKLRTKILEYLIRVFEEDNDELKSKIALILLRHIRIFD